MDQILCKNESQNALENLLKCQRNGSLCVFQCNDDKPALLSSVKSALLLRESASDCKKDMFACQVPCKNNLATAI